MLRLSARWVLPVSGPAIEGGAALVDDRGRIVAVGPDATVPRPPQARIEELPHATLLPGLVNTHTHLELTGFAGQAEDEVFWDWIKHIIALKSARSDEDFFLAAERGIQDCWAAGVTTVCDMGNSGQVIAAMHAQGAAGIAHHEVFDLHQGEPAETMRRFSGELDRLAPHAAGRVQLGVSPHAPYTVSGPVYRETADLARAHGVPIGVHIAEPQDETALLRDFTGTFADFLRSRGVSRLAPEPVSPVAWLDRHGVLSPRTICAHAIHTDLADAELLRRHGAAVAHCPRSNRRHHRADAPVRRYLDQGIRLGLGTDSEVSVAPLDLVAEAREARVLTGWNAAETLRALTLGGAEALNLSAETGSLEPGKWADVVALATPEHPDPFEAVLTTGPRDVAVTWLAGREVHRDAEGG
jgi:5-methylthioadenosine/S-adenosylhomocysteine deaminase